MSGDPHFSKAAYSLVLALCSNIWWHFSLSSPTRNSLPTITVTIDLRLIFLRVAQEMRLSINYILMINISLVCKFVGLQLTSSSRLFGQSHPLWYSALSTVSNSIHISWRSYIQGKQNIRTNTNWEQRRCQKFSNVHFCKEAKQDTSSKLYGESSILKEDKADFFGVDFFVVCLSK